MSCIPTSTCRSVVEVSSESQGPSSQLQPCTSHPHVVVSCGLPRVKATITGSSSSSSEDIRIDNDNMCMPPVKTTITCLSSSSSEDVRIIDNENIFEVSMQQIVTLVYLCMVLMCLHVYPCFTVGLCYSVPLKCRHLSIIGSNYCAQINP